MKLIDIGLQYIEVRVSGTVLAIQSLITNRILYFPGGLRSISTRNHVCAQKPEMKSFPSFSYPAGRN